MLKQNWTRICVTMTNGEVKTYQLNSKGRLAVKFSKNSPRSLTLEISKLKKNSSANQGELDFVGNISTNTYTSNSPELATILATTNQSLSDSPNPSPINILDQNSLTNESNLGNSTPNQMEMQTLFDLCDSDYMENTSLCDQDPFDIFGDEGNFDFPMFSQIDF